MSCRLIIRPEAETDIVEAALWYEGRERGLGLEVTGEIHAAMARASQNPLAYLIVRETPSRSSDPCAPISLSHFLHRPR